MKYVEFQRVLMSGIGCNGFTFEIVHARFNCSRF